MSSQAQCLTNRMGVLQEAFLQDALGHKACIQTSKLCSSALDTRK